MKKEQDREIIGYCSSCKEPIFINDDFVKEKNILYCMYCYKVENNIVEELNFEHGQ